MKRLLYTWRQARANRRARRNQTVLQTQYWPIFPEQQIQDDDESWDDDEDLWLEEEALCELEQDNF